MKRKLIGLLAFCMMTAVFTGCLEVQKSDPYGLAGKTHSAVTPVDRPDVKWWMPRHEDVLERVAQGNVDLIMVGDSITHGWEKGGKPVWEEYYAPRNAVNMGFGGDRTQHVLWRFDQGEIDGIRPKLAVLMIGTNNSNGNDNTAEEIADGIKAICAEIREKLPRTKILILAIFPRSDSSNRPPKGQNASFNPQWAKNNKASELASEIADGKMVFYLDINEKFLEENGELPREIMPDLLHPNAKGYKIWAEAMEPTVKKLMGE
ncbi:MAG: platelet-activating factor acetylhydrolase IB subunit [Phycisphaerae bacterium]|nr:platelet-activating factor acetylhydrolase IB subunit [Phycisphaerae bacterium]